MSTDLTCPDCGGIVGARETTDEGKPCTCFRDTPRYSSSASEGSTSGHSTEIMAAPTPAPAVTEVKKICVSCGADVTHRQRARDSRGYFCADCAKAEKEATKPKGVKCGDCGRVVVETGLYDVGGVRVCTFCRDDRNAAAQRGRKYGKVADSAYKKDAKMQIFTTAGIVGVLVLIILLHHFKILG
jgi:hypothetical protein